MDTRRGHIIVDMGLGLPEHCLTDDEQVRCLSYTCKHLNQIPDLLIPEGVGFEIIPVEYLGGPYPCIGMFTTASTDSDAHLTDVSFVLETRMARWAKEIGLNTLLALSEEETLCWQDVLNGLRR